MLYARQISQILAILIFSLVFSYANARGTDLKFQSVVSAVSQTDSNEGTVTVFSSITISIAPPLSN